MTRRLDTCRLIFVAGVEGSGTTLFAKLLSEVKGTLALGGNYFSDERPDFSVEATRNHLQGLTRTLWGKALAPEQREAILEKIAATPLPDDIATVVYKRSFPFGAVGRSPRLGDLTRFAPDYRVIWVDRPRLANAASILRRGMAASPEEAALRAKDGAIAIVREIATLPGERLCKIDYEAFTQDPAADLARLESFVSYPKGSLAAHQNLIQRPSAQSRALEDQHRALFEKLLGDE